MTIKESVLFTKKKKKVVGTATEQRQWPPCGDRSDPRPMTSGAEPSGQASFAPAIGTASGAGGKKTKADSATARPEGAALWPGAGERHGSRRGRRSCLGAPPAERPEHCFPSGPQAGHARLCTRAHASAHTHARSALPRTLPPAPAAHASDPPPELPLPSRGVCPGPTSARTHTCTRRGTPGGGSSTLARAGTRAHADPRALSSPRSP